jgi:regulator of CtrA degradation
MLAMSLKQSKTLMTARLVDGLYTEAMLLADEARSYFDEFGRADRDALTPLQRVTFSCESLKVTTRLMHVIAWLLTRKAIAAGEIQENDGSQDSRRLGQAALSDAETVAGLPEVARELVRGSIDLYERVARIDQDMLEPEADSPALGLLRRLERTL